MKIPYLNGVLGKIIKMNNYEEPIRYLNELTGRNFDWKNKSTQRLLNGRYNEGRTLEDIKEVIKFMCTKWVGTKWEEFLRPSTLFNATRFENYINEVNFADMKNDKIGGFRELQRTFRIYLRNI